MTGVPHRQAKTVLVVEDNPGDARLVAIYLEEESGRAFRVVHVDHLKDALAVLASQHIDVALLDLSLPDSFGLETLARLRAAQPLVPVVVLTGTDNEALALDSLRQGAQDYLVKGVSDGDAVRRSIRYAIERARVDQELRTSEAQFRAVFANAGVGVILLSREGRYVEANRAFAGMLGYSEAELKGIHFEDVTFPEDAAKSTGAFRELVEGVRDSYQAEKRYVAKDGRVVWGRITVTAVRDEATSDLRYAVGVVEDVTERKRLEDHLRMAATVFENTGDGLFITDSDCRIIHVNRAFTAITGYQPDEVLGQTPRVLSSGRHGADFYSRMWQALETAGRWQGEIWDRRQTGEMFVGWQSIAVVRNPDGGVTNYVAVISDITSRKQVEERLSYAANHDPLTRLPNRTLFHERLSRALARAQRNQDVVALLFIDLDHFKQVNDTQGHLAGDMLLQQVAERLSSSIRLGDTVARLAGDEFTVLLEEIQDPRDAAIVAHKIVRMLGEPFDLNGATASISSSVGVAVYPADAGDAETLIKLADAAMYRAKHLGRNGCQFHSEAVNAQAFERLVLEEALRGALDRHEFRLFYQPVFEAATGRVVAVEALLRWRHPEVGMVVPTQFLPVAEEIGLMLPIGQWVLDTACRQARAWHEMGFPTLQIDVNVSARQLRQADIVETVASALEASRVAPDRLVLEIPEGSLADRGAEPGGLFARFVAMGVNIAVDEFGAGYSSFSLLRRLPANALKIAQSFVRNVATSTDDAEIVTAIAAVARGLHMSIVASGIETEEQFGFLADFGSDRVQGFLFSRPMTAEAMTDYLKAGTVPPQFAARAARRGMPG